jgi:hypothetical protein
MIVSLFPYTVVGDDGDNQIPLVAIKEGRGYFNPKPSEVIDVPRLQVGSSLYAPGQEVIEMRQENSKTTYLGKVGKDDKYALDVSMGAIHYKDDYNSSEQWKDIDLTFENGKITKAPYELTVDGQSITVRDKKTNSIVALTLSEIGTKSIAKPSYSFSKGKATALNIATDTDLEIVVDNTRVKFTRVLKSSLAPAECKFGLSQSGTGITVDYKAVDSSVSNKDIKVVASLKDGVLTESVDTKGVTYPLRVDPTLDILVSANADDTSVYWTGVWNIIDDTNNRIGDYTGVGTTKMGVGLRWLNVTVPSGGNITSSYVIFTAHNGTASGGATAKAKVVGNLQVNAANFTTLADYQSRRGTEVGGADNTKRTVAEVIWNPIELWSLGEYGADTTTPEIKTVVQEIIGQVGWAYGNSLALFVGDHTGASSANAYRFAESRNLSASGCPKLHIEYVYLPTILSIAASSVEETTATVGGNVTAMGSGNITSYGIQYGNTTLYGSWCNTTATKTAIFSYYCYLGTNTSALDPGELYYYRAWAYDNIDGYSYGYYCKQYCNFLYLE